MKVKIHVHIEQRRKFIKIAYKPLIWPVRVDCDREFNVFAVFGVRPEFADDEDTKLMPVPKLSDLKN